MSSLLSITCVSRFREWVLTIRVMKVRFATEKKSKKGGVPLPLEPLKLIPRLLWFHKVRTNIRILLYVLF